MRPSTDWKTNLKILTLFNRMLCANCSGNSLNSSFNANETKLICFSWTQCIFYSRISRISKSVLSMPEFSLGECAKTAFNTLRISVPNGDCFADEVYVPKKAQIWSFHVALGRIRNVPKRETVSRHPSSTINNKTHLDINSGKLTAQNHDFVLGKWQAITKLTKMEMTGNMRSP